MDTQTEEAIGAYCSQSFMMKCASILGNARLEEYEYNSSDDSMVIAIELNGPINTSRVEDVIVSMFKHKPVVLSGAYTQEYIIKGCAAYYNANIKIRAPKSPSLVYRLLRWLLGIYFMLFIYNLFYLDLLSTLEWETKCHREVLVAQGRIHPGLVDPPSYLSQIIMAAWNTVTMLGSLGYAVYLTTTSLLSSQGDST
jgi:hypothetical protein